jgi:hypothetical protein
MHFEDLDPTPENVDRVRDEIWAEVQRLYALGREVTRAPGRRPKYVDTAAN